MSSFSESYLINSQQILATKFLFATNKEFNVQLTEMGYKLYSVICAHIVDVYSPHIIKHVIA